jgi:hypothetical protein
MSFTEEDLELVKREKLQMLAETFGAKRYGTKADLAGRITIAKGGKGALTKLIKTCAKEKESKGKSTPTGGKSGPKAEFFKKERARLIAAGATDKKKIEAEIKRLWEQSTSKCKGGICKKSIKAKDDKTTIVTSNKMLTPVEAKARNLALVGANASNGNTSFTYKVISAKKKPLPVKRSSDQDDDDQDDDDEMVTRAQIEDEMIARLKAKMAKMAKKKKREHLDGMTEVFGVDTKGWSLAHAQEELVIQMMQETDDEDDDDEDEEADEKEDEDEDDDDDDDDDN